MTKTKVEEIYESVLPEMAKNDIEDTVENRISFLQGLQDAWAEDSDDSLEKALWQVALAGELLSLETKLMLRAIK
jgi:hypothetical protein